MKKYIIKGKGYSDSPKLLKSSSGKIFLANLRYRDRKEFIELNRISEKCFVPRKEHIIFENPMILAPELAEVKDRLFVCAPLLVNGKWTIRIRTLSGSKLSKIFSLPSGFAHNYQPRICVDANGVMWFVWTGIDNGNYGIYCISYSDGNWSDIICISGTAGNSRNPAVAINKNTGIINIAWDQSNGKSYEILTRNLDITSGRLTPIVQITRNMDFNVHPSLYLDKNDRLFLAWENYKTNAKGYGFENYGSPEIIELEKQVSQGGIGRRLDRKSMLVFCEKGSWKYLRDKSLDTAMPVTGSGEKSIYPFTSGICKGAVRPGVFTDANNNVYIYNYVFNHSTWCWDFELSRYHDGKWTKTVSFQADKGIYLEAVSVLPEGGKVLVAFQKACGKDEKYFTPAGKRRPRNYGHKTLRNRTCRSFTGIVEFGLNNAADGKNILCKIYKTYPFKSQKETAKRFPVKSKTENYFVYWGDTHVHSELSVCARSIDGSPEDNALTLRDIGGLDFCNITDHDKSINFYDWHVLQKLSLLHSYEDNFILFPGYEFVKYVKNYAFHRHVLNRDAGESIYVQLPGSDNPGRFWKNINGKKIISILHQSGDVNHINTWKFHNKDKEPLMEIYQVRGSYEYYGCKRNTYQQRYQYCGNLPLKGEINKNNCMEKWCNKDGYAQNALALGYITGFTGGGEHESVGITGVIAKSLIRKDIFDALTNRRTYATTGAKIGIDFQINSHITGEVFATNSARKIEVRVTAPQKIKFIELIRNNELFHKFSGKSKNGEFSVNDDSDLNKCAYPPRGDFRKPFIFYYLRITLADNEMAWTSPIWVIYQHS